MALTLEDVKAMVKEVVSEEVAPLKAQNTDWMGDMAKAIANANQEVKTEPKGEFGSRILMALAAGKGSLDKAAAYAKEHFYSNDKAGQERFEKALAAGEATSGGFLLRESVDDGLIELLRPASVIRASNPLTVGLDGGNLRMPKLASGSSGGWIGENQNAPATQPSFGSVLLQAKKYASLVPISNDLIRRSPTNATQVVRDDMVADIATSTDLAYIRADGTDGQPKGLRNLAAAAGVNAMTATPIVSEVIDDLGSMIQRMMDNDVRMLRPQWLIEPRTWKALFTMLDANANPVFRPELAQGTIFGIPFKISSQIPRNLGGGTETEVYLVDFADIILGEATSIMVDVSDSAAYHDGSNVVASYSLDQTVLRAIVETDLNTRHAESIQVLTGVTWDSVAVS
jgi:HK97 family phage major capsid protein